MSNAVATINSYLTKPEVLTKIAEHAKRGQDTTYAERVVRGVMMAVRNSKDPQMMTVKPESIYNCINNAFNMGLTIDGREYAYLVRYGDEAKISIGYKGYVARLVNGLQNCDIQTFLIYRDDVFVWESKNGVASYEYTPAKRAGQDYEGIERVVCYISYTVNGKDVAIIEELYRDEILKIKSKAKTQNVWNEWFGEMAKKAVIKRACKTKFAHLVADFEEYDNEDYEMAPVQRESAVDRINKKLANKKYNPEQQGEVIDGEFKQVDAPDGSLPTVNNSGSDATTEEQMRGETPSNEVEKEEVTEPDIANFTIVYQGKPVDRKWPNFKAPYSWLVTNISKLPKDQRMAEIEANAPYLAAINTIAPEMYDALITMAKKETKNGKR